jgi:AcrR family transcriptional regulator
MPARVNAAARRREIVAQAAELFDRSGYHTANVSAVAEAAGMRKPTLYHYFSSKDEILFEIHDEFIDLLIEKERGRRGLAAKEALLEVMADVLELMRTHRGHVRVFFEHYRELSEADQETIRAKRDGYQARVEAIVRRGIEAGEFRDVDPRLTTLAVFGMCNWAYQWYRPDGPLSARAIAERYFDLLFEGLARR